ncbi:MAG: hypothetical protein KC469_05170 [Flavobacteriaceae bacterium]|jgi:hypothetical protein|nr:hypothetical protein [Flavobacteriaceae bacterium]
MKKSILLLFLISMAFVSCETDEIQTVTENQELLIEDRSKEDNKCETAFAYFKDGCFLEDGFNRWGWVIGPLKEGFEDEFDIYQGAGQCDLSKGQLIGSLSVKYLKKGSVEVIYRANPGYAFYETHLYVGNEKYPTLNNGNPTVAPGKYTAQHSYPEGELKDYYEFDKISGNIYIIAHAVVCLNNNK